MRKYIALVLTIIWALLIFNFSSDNGEESSSLSRDIIVKTVEIFTDIKNGDKKMDEIVDKYSFIIRKCAHFFMYYCFAFLIMLTLYLFGVKRRTLIISSIIAIVFAISDEAHQAFVDGRSGNINDVLLDSSAALFSNYLFHKFVIMKRLYKKNT